jgi:hypothetical protein
VQWYIICAGGYYSLSMKKIEKNDTMSCIKFKIRTRRCSLSYILLMCRTHFHDRHISLSGVVYTHKTSLTPPRLPVASHKSERSRVLRVSNVTCIYFAFVPTIFLLDFVTVPRVWNSVLFVFHVIGRKLLKWSWMDIIVHVCGCHYYQMCTWLYFVRLYTLIQCHWIRLWNKMV